MLRRDFVPLLHCPYRNELCIWSPLMPVSPSPQATLSELLKSASQSDMMVTCILQRYHEGDN